MAHLIWWPTYLCNRDRASLRRTLRSPPWDGHLTFYSVNVFLWLISCPLIFIDPFFIHITSFSHVVFDIDSILLLIMRKIAWIKGACIRYRFHFTFNYEENSLDKGARLLSWQVWLFATVWTVAHQAPLFMAFSGHTQILKWVAISSSRGSSPIRDRTHVSCLAGGFFTAKPPGKPQSGGRALVT